MPQVVFQNNHYNGLTLLRNFISTKLKPHISTAKHVKKVTMETAAYEIYQARILK